ncbi:LysM peptidoglycan-binding domain-containing protein [Crenobacter sp. SG2305]|uniref:lytic transglycosylase n=1 Tax=Crenobacter oryzisoli TaxID=3056844 RepID=UPI0025AA3EA6|nr:LysM peptidoglycan-binding domain-containing protein [Crenobacter sp. SG2305]MDN0081791.1 LysM peptidoglycan-binding domain-containing protein [Crenobacter sp. SG2305]
MKRFKPLALSLSLLCLYQITAPAQASTADSRGVDIGLSSGLDMMLLNSSLLRNGDNVWERAREGFQMTEVNSELIRRQERYYASRPEYFKRTLDRSRKYLFFIMNEVERRGMPTELAFLPMVESAFNPTAMSSVGASGLWQFMPSTGRQYGLEQTWWYDGRRDVTDATRAALDYLQNLYGMFGDWSLALAAYNWGEGNLSRAIARVRARGEEPTYENINMPAETRNYVPKLLAVRNLLADPAKFGLKLERFQNKPYFVAVTTGKHMDIDIAAKLADMSVSEFKELNPGFNLPVYAYKNGRQMLLPANRLEKFEHNLAKWGDKPLMTWQVYTPGGNESVADVAANYGMSASELRSVNRLAGYTLTAGRPILVAMKGNTNNGAPLIDRDDGTTTAPLMIAKADPAPAISPAVITASLKQPQTPATITTTPAVKVAEVKNVESAKAVPSVPATAVAVAAAAPAPASTPAVAPTIATAAMAATQPAVAQAAPTSTPTKVADVNPAANQVANTPSAVAPQLALATPATTTSAPLNVSAATEALALADDAAVSSPAPARTIAVADAAPVVSTTGHHIVASGDTLYNISRRYNMSVADLKSLNGLTDDYVKLGQVLSVDKSNLATPTLLVQGNDTSRSKQGLSKVSGEYVAQKGDTLYSIARKFGVAHQDIKRWNRVSMANRLQPGQIVKIQGL